MLLSTLNPIITIQAAIPATIQISTVQGLQAALDDKQDEIVISDIQSDIRGNRDRLDSVQIDIGALSSAVSSHTFDIANNSTRITTNSNSITTVTGRLDALETSQTAQDTLIATKQTILTGISSVPGLEQELDNKQDTIPELSSRSLTQVLDPIRERIDTNVADIRSVNEIKQNLISDESTLPLYLATRFNLKLDTSVFSSFNSFPFALQQRILEIEESIVESFEPDLRAENVLGLDALVNNSVTQRVQALTQGQLDGKQDAIETNEDIPQVLANEIENINIRINTFLEVLNRDEETTEEIDTTIARVENLQTMLNTINAAITALETTTSGHATTLAEDTLNARIDSRATTVATDLDTTQTTTITTAYEAGDTAIQTEVRDALDDDGPANLDSASILVAMRGFRDRIISTLNTNISLEVANSLRSISIEETAIAQSEAILRGEFEAADEAIIETAEQESERLQEVNLRVTTLEANWPTAEAQVRGDIQNNYEAYVDEQIGNLNISAMDDRFSNHFNIISEIYRIRSTAQIVFTPTTSAFANGFNFHTAAFPNTSGNTEFVSLSTVPWIEQVTANTFRVSGTFTPPILLEVEFTISIHNPSTTQHLLAEAHVAYFSPAFNNDVSSARQVIAVTPPGLEVSGTMRAIIRIQDVNHNFSIIARRVSGGYSGSWAISRSELSFRRIT